MSGISINELSRSSDPAVLLQRVKKVTQGAYCDNRGPLRSFKIDLQKIKESKEKRAELI